MADADASGSRMGEELLQAGTPTGTEDRGDADDVLADRSDDHRGVGRRGWDIDGRAGHLGGGELLTAALLEEFGACETTELRHGGAVIGGCDASSDHSTGVQLSDAAEDGSTTAPREFVGADLLEIGRRQRFETRDDL